MRIGGRQGEFWPFREPPATHISAELVRVERTTPRLMRHCPREKCLWTTPTTESRVVSELIGSGDRAISDQQGDT
jgi:hypothetical protein